MKTADDGGGGAAAGRAGVRWRRVLAVCVCLAVFAALWAVIDRGQRANVAPLHYDTNAAAAAATAASSTALDLSSDTGSDGTATEPRLKDDVGCDASEDAGEGSDTRAKSDGVAASGDGANAASSGSAGTAAATVDSEAPFSVFSQPPPLVVESDSDGVRWYDSLQASYDGRSEHTHWNDDGSVYCFTITDPNRRPVYDVCSDEFMPDTPCPCWDRKSKLPVNYSGDIPSKVACMPCAAFVGFPKTGTTTLYSEMTDHSGVAYNVPHKEPRPFQPNSHTYMDYYTTTQAQAASIVLKGKQTHDYSITAIWFHVEESIARQWLVFNPDVRIGVMMREPVAAEVSQFFFMRHNEPDHSAFQGLSPVERADYLHKSVVTVLNTILEYVTYPEGRKGVFDSDAFAALGCTYDAGSLFEALIVRAGHLSAEYYMAKFADDCGAAGVGKRCEKHGAILLTEYIYSYHIVRWSSWFRFGDRLALFTLDELQSDREAFYRRLQSYLGLEYESLARHRTNSAPITEYAHAETLQLLKDFYRPFNCHLTTLTGDTRYLDWQNASHERLLPSDERLSAGGMDVHVIE